MKNFVQISKIENQNEILYIYNIDHFLWLLF